MTPQLIVQDMLKAGLTRKQIAKRAKITEPSVGNILNGKVTAVHGRTWFGLLSAHSACIKAAQKRLQAAQDAKAKAEAEVARLSLAASFREATE